MNTLTYRQAYDKIIEAYFKDEIKPWDAEFCFCGNLCDKSGEWYMLAIPNNMVITKGYRGFEFHMMERALLDTMYEMNVFASTNVDTKKYEDALFAGMVKALDVLKEIHRSRGENVDEDIPAFTKREFAKQILK